MISPTTVFQGMTTWDSVMALPVEERIRSFRDPEIRRALSIEGVETEGTHRYRMNRGTRTMSFNRRWDLVQVYMAHEERNRRYSGMSVEDIAQEQGKGIMDAFLDLVLDDDLRTSFQVIDRNSDPDSQREILGSPYTVIGTTDGGARPDKGDRTTYSTYLLSHWVREEQVMTLEDAVYRMTGKRPLCTICTIAASFRLERPLT